MPRYKVLADIIELKSSRGTFKWDKGSEVGDLQVDKETDKSLEKMIKDKKLRIISDK